MTGNYDNLVRKCQKLAPNRFDDFRERAAPQVGAADTAGKKCIAREHRWNNFVQNETYAARRMPGRMHHLKTAAAHIKTFAFL